MAIVKLVRVKQLAEMFGVSKRQMQRDLDKAGIQPYTIKPYANGRKCFLYKESDIEKWQKKFSRDAILNN